MNTFAYDLSADLADILSPMTGKLIQLHSYQSAF